MADNQAAFTESLQIEINTEAFAIRAMVDEVLRSLSPQFNRMYKLEVQPLKSPRDHHLRVSPPVGGG